MIDLSRICALLVEDDEDHQFIMQAKLGRIGFKQIRVAGTMAEAVEAIAHQSFEIVLLDLSLPDSRGLETVGRIREFSRQVPVVVLTANQDTQMAQAAVVEGAEDYLIKGELSVREFDRSIRFGIERHRQRRELARLTEQLQAANRKLLELSKTDELTGLFNRRAFEHRLRAEWGRGGRLGTPLTLISIDIDSFKQVNDVHGHPEGDRALKLLASIIGRFARRALDLGARIGGDEFALLLAGTDESQAQEIAAQILSSVSGLEFHDGLSVSVGIATMTPEAETAPDLLVERADAALYRAKESGRSQWRSAP